MNGKTEKRKENIFPPFFRNFLFPPSPPPRSPIKGAWVEGRRSSLSQFFLFFSFLTTGQKWMVEREGVFPTARKMMPPLSLFPEKKEKKREMKGRRKCTVLPKKWKGKKGGDENALAQFVHLVTFPFLYSTFFGASPSLQDNFRLLNPRKKITPKYVTFSMSICLFSRI